MLRRESIASQAALRLVVSLSLLVALIAIGSVGIYRAALHKASQERAEELVKFYASRLEQLERDWEISSRDFKVRMEYTRALEDPATATETLQAFMTIQGTDRRFQYLLIQGKDGQKVFDFGKDLNLASIPDSAKEALGHFLDEESNALYRVFVLPIWLGEKRGTGRFAVFFRIDNALLGQLAAPGIALSAVHDGKVAASSGGHEAIDRLTSGLAGDGREIRDIPWGGGLAGAHPIHLKLEAPVVTLFTTTELAIGMSAIPIIDGLVLWFTIGLWLMLQARRITRLDDAVREYSGAQNITPVVERALADAAGKKHDEIAQVGTALKSMVGEIEMREQEREAHSRELRSLNQLQQAILDNAGYAIISTTPDGLITTFNKAAERMLGYRADELVGRQTPAVFHDPDEVAARARDFGQMLNISLEPDVSVFFAHAQRGLPSEFEWTYVRKDGSHFPVLLSVTALRDEAGTTTGYLGIAADITARKQAEEALRASETRLLEAQHTARIGNWELDLATGRLFWSDEIFRLFELDPAMFGPSYEAFLAAIHPADREMVSQAYSDSLANRTPYEITHRLLMPDGRVKWVSERCRTDFDAQGKPLRSSGTVQDVTEIKHAEAEYKSILETSQDGFWLVSSQDGRLLDVNPAATRMLGHTREEMLRMRIPDIDAILSPEEVIHSIQRIMESPEHAARFESRHRCRDGRLIDVEVSAQYLEARGGVFVSFVRDITEQKQAEKNLIEAKNQAEAANRAKSEFLANMSHEIRTPMNAILGLTRLVLESELQPQQESYLRKVLTSSQGLLGLLNDILDYSKIEADRMEIERVPLHVEDVLRGVAELFSARIEEKGLELFLDIDPDIPAEVLGDPLRLAQVLNNLVGNAVKFTERGEICIKVTAAPDDTGLTLAFTVRDTGIGLDPERAEHLFQPFTQADSSVTRKYGGTGLGLSICHRLVSLMGGEIGATGTPGKGATFRFSIRVDYASQAASASDLQQVSGLRVLVVDDQETARQILLDMITAWRIKVETVASGAEALERFEQAEREGIAFDVVLLDWRMPGMDGLDVARRIRARGDTQPQLLMMTPHFNRDALLNEAGSLGIDGLLPKPLIPSHLFDLLISRRGRPARLARDDSAAVSLRFDGAHILLVEDNSLNQEVASAFLERRGVTVALANDGAEALERIAEQRFDAVLMDLHMPGMDGIEATRRIRALPGGRDLPIIAMTAAVLPEDRTRCAEVGMVDFVAKPVDPDDLNRCLRRWLPAHAREATVEGGRKAILAELPGFELNRALCRLDGDKDRLFRLLQRFAEERAGALPQLEALLEAGRPDEATELLHALSGAAANLGAAELGDAARQLEQEVGAGGAAASLDRFAAALGSALAAIATLPRDSLAEAGEGGVPTEPDREQLTGLLNDLLPYLRSGELIPDGLMHNLEGLAQQERHRKFLAALLKHIDNFNHESALAETFRLSAMLGLELHQ